VPLVSPRQFSTGLGLGRVADVAEGPPHDATVKVRINTEHGRALPLIGYRYRRSFFFDAS